MYDVVSSSLHFRSNHEFLSIQPNLIQFNVYLSKTIYNLNCFEGTFDVSFTAVFMLIANKKKCKK